MAVARRPLLIQWLLAAGLFLNAATVSSVAPLLPFLVAALHGPPQMVAHLLAVSCGCTLAALVPSALLLAYTSRVVNLSIGLLCSLAACCLLSTNSTMWQLYLAMLVVGCSLEFTFAASLGIVCELHANFQPGEDPEGSAEQGGQLAAAPGPDTPGPFTQAQPPGPDKKAMLFRLPSSRISQAHISGFSRVAPISTETARLGRSMSIGGAPQLQRSLTLSARPMVWGGLLNQPVLLRGPSLGRNPAPNPGITKLLAGSSAQFGRFFSMDARRGPLQEAPANPTPQKLLGRLSSRALSRAPVFGGDKRTPDPLLSRGAGLVGIEETSSKECAGDDLELGKQLLTKRDRQHHTPVPSGKTKHLLGKSLPAPNWRLPQTARYSKLWGVSLSGILWALPSARSWFQFYTA